MAKPYAVGDAVIRISDKQMMFVNFCFRNYIEGIYVDPVGTIQRTEVQLTDIKPVLIVSEPLYKEDAKGNGGGKEFVPDDFKDIYDSAEPKQL